MCNNESRLSQGGFACERVGADNVVIHLGFINVTREEVVGSIFHSVLFLCLLQFLSQTHHLVLCTLFTLLAVRFQDVRNFATEHNILTTIGWIVIESSTD